MSKLKVGDTITFKFAGGRDSGVIQEIAKKGNKILAYKVTDTKYVYWVTKEQIIK